MKQLFFFSGSHCPNCPGVKEQLQKTLNGDVDVKFFDVDKPEDARIAARYGVMGLPTILHMEDKTPMNSYVGTTAVERLQEDGVL
jgi:thiol-disulfide isomerase/thioredoxin